MKKSLAALALVAASTLALAGCSGAAGGAATKGDGAKVSVVATTNVYGSIAAEIGGDRVQVTSIIDSLTKDPHEYEATARDRLAVRDADLVIENGGGYDPFMEDLLDGSKAQVVVAAEFSHDYPGNAGHDATPSADAAPDDHDDADHDDHAGDDDHDHDHIEGFNEHVWFDPHTMTHLVEDVAHHLTELDPQGKEQYAKGAAALTADLESAEGELAAIKAKAGGAGVFITEPVPGYLAAAAGLVDKAPEGFASAVEEGHDVAPATLLAAVTVIKSGEVKAVLANGQAGGSETQRIEQEAKGAGVPVVTFTEILPKDTAYAEWMHAAIASLAAAVGA